MVALNSHSQINRSQAIGIGVGGNIKESLDGFARKVQERAARSATFAVADAIRNEMKINARKGEYATGALADAIYTYYDTEKSDGKTHVYAVGVNKRKAGNWHWIEYGRWRHYQTIKIDGEWVTLKDRPLDVPVWVPPTPYLRPAYESQILTSFDVFKRRFASALREA